MEADWEFEIGGQAPVIDAAWPGFVDLRSQPGRIHEIAETARAPALAGALLRLNSSASPVFTAKCDVWVPEAIDPDELDSTDEEVTFARACYIDLLPRESGAWRDPARAETFCRRLYAALKPVPARNCRADLVVRRAVLHAGQETLGITAYLTACGATEDHAAAALAALLAAIVDSCCELTTEEKLQ